MIKKRKIIRYRGTSLVEAALVFPLLLILTLGAIEYGWLFLKAQQVTNAARQGARIAIRPDATNAQVLTVINNLMALAGMADTGYQVDFSPEDISAVGAGASVNIEVTVPCENIAIIDVPLLPTPTAIRAVMSMAKEGP